MRKIIVSENKLSIAEMPASRRIGRPKTAMANTEQGQVMQEAQQAGQID